MRIALSLCLLLLTCLPALAHDFTAGDLTVLHPAVSVTPGGATVGAGYLAVRNSGATLDRLVAVESPAAGKVEIHTTSNESGVVRMRRLEGGLPVPAHGEAVLEPGGDHLMFMDLKEPFTLGNPVPAVLIFERAGRLPVTFAVEPMGAGMPHHD